MGICRGGKTLMEVINERDRLFRETGYLWGLEKLELMESDPVKFDRFQWKLLAAVYAARETSKLVSASPAGFVRSRCSLSFQQGGVNPNRLHP